MARKQPAAEAPAAYRVLADLLPLAAESGAITQYKRGDFVDIEDEANVRRLLEAGAIAPSGAPFRERVTPTGPSDIDLKAMSAQELITYLNTHNDALDRVRAMEHERGDDARKDVLQAVEDINEELEARRAADAARAAADAALDAEDPN